jgi:glycerophosphoryl diester phosphodiesterase
MIGVEGAIDLGRGQELRMRVAAHRGGAGLWPENSLLAFENALKLGVDGLECDVHLTRDGEVVVLHDPTLPLTRRAARRRRGVSTGVQRGRGGVSCGLDSRPTR